MPSQGTARTALEIISGAARGMAGGEWVEAGGETPAGSYEFPPPVGRQRMIRYPSGEQITVPRHIPTRNVRTTMNASAFGERAARAAHCRDGASGRAGDEDAAEAPAPERSISRLPEGPTPAQRERMRWMIVCEAKRGEVERKGVISGKDVYGLTAAAIRQGSDDRGGARLRRSGRTGALAGVRSEGVPRRPRSLRRALARRGGRIAHFRSRPEPNADRTGTRRRRAVSLEDAASTTTPRCPACGEPLFVWIETDRLRSARGPGHRPLRELRPGARPRGDPDT